MFWCDASYCLDPRDIHIQLARFAIRTTAKGVTKDETFNYVLNIDVTGWTQDELLALKSTHWKGSESWNH